MDPMTEKSERDSSDGLMSAGTANNSLWAMDPMASKAEDMSMENNSLFQMDPMAQPGETSAANNSLFQMDPMAKPGDISAANNCLFQMDPMAKPVDTTAADNSLFQMDPMAKPGDISAANNFLFQMDPMAKPVDTTAADNSLFQMDPMAKLGDTTAADNSLFQMDPMAKPGNTTAADNSLFQMDPMAKPVDTTAADNSLFQMDPMAKPGDKTAGDNSLFQMDPMAKTVDTTAANKSLFQMDLMAKQLDTTAANSSLFQMDLMAKPVDTTAADNSLFQMDPMAKQVNTTAADNSLFQMDPMAKQVDTTAADNSLFQMDPLAKPGDTTAANNSLFQMDPMAKQLDTTAANSSLFQMDPMAKPVDTTAADNSLFQMDPMAKQVNTTAADNSLFQMDPMAKQVDTTAADNSLFQMDPMAKPGDTTAADNSLFQMDPMAKQVNTTAADNSLFQMDPMAKPVDTTAADNSLFQMDPMAKPVDTTAADTSMINNTSIEVDPSSRSVDISYANNSLLQMDQMAKSESDEEGANDSLKLNSTEELENANLSTIVKDLKSEANTSSMSMKKDQSMTSDKDSEIRQCKEDSVSSSNLLECNEETRLTKETDGNSIADQSPQVEKKPSITESEISQDFVSTVTSLDNSMGSENSHYITSFTSPRNIKMNDSALTETSDKQETSPVPKHDASIDRLEEKSVMEQVQDVPSISSYREESFSIRTTPISAEEVQVLREQLKAKDNDLQLAAEIGKRLLESNNEKEKQLQEVMKEMSGKVEALEQEKYSLSLRLSQREKMEDNYRDEVDTLKAALRRQQEEHDEFVEAEHNNRVMELKNQLRGQQTELEQSQLACKQLEERAAQLDELLKEAREQLEHKINVMNETCSEELAQMQTEINTLQNDKIVLTRELSESKNREERYEHSLQRAMAQVEGKDQEIEERQAQATSYYNSLEKAREEVQDLKVELDVLRMETQGRRAKGNSLFSEVEDRRINAEKELISLKVELDSISKQYKITRQHEHTLKLQLSVLLQKAGHTADKQHMERLQQMLAQAHGEVNILAQKLKDAETQPQQKNPKAELYDAWCKDVYKNDPTRMQFFEKVLENKEKENESLKAELKTKRMLLLAEDQKVLKYEGLLYDTERQLEKQRDCNIKLNLKVDALKMKYEPDRQGTGEILKGNVEKIPISKKANKEKENKPVIIKDVVPKGKTKATEPKKDALDGVKVPSFPKPMSKADASGKSTKPALRSLQKKSVRLSEDIDVIEPQKTAELPDEPSEGKEPVEEEGQKKGGRVRGRERYNKVNMVRMEGKEEVGCNQQ